MMRKLLILFVATGWLAGCSTTPRIKPSSLPPPPEMRSAGGYYLDDGPEANPPQNLHEVPDADPRDEPLHKFANRPYEAMGVSYTPMSSREPFRQSGVASWYGKRFHGKKTSSGEIYDMYGMTAAHPTLPIPSYVKVTALDTGRSVIVRVNDRGPFHSDRVIDLSYTAAYKLGLLQKGSGKVTVESVGPETEVIRPLAAVEPIEAVPLAPVPAPLAPAPAPGNDRKQAAPSAGIYVQLGAFGNLENARKLLARARAALAIPAELVQIALVGNLHLVNLGPFADRNEASGWVDKSNTALGIAAITVTR
jgi:rare lipoprotein A